MNDKRKPVKFLLVTPLLILTILSTSCRTFPEKIVEYRNRPIPSVAWPTFPDPKGIVARNADGTVVMPTEYWLAVTRYVIDVEAGIEKIEEYRESDQ